MQAKAKVRIIKRFAFLALSIAIYGCAAAFIDNKSDDISIFYKQAAAKEVIHSYEGWLPKAKHDGFDEKTGKDIYTIGFGTRAKAGETIDFNKATIAFNKYLNANVWTKLDPSLPINKYVAYASFLYSTSFGKQPTSCEDILIPKYKMPNTKYENGLAKRRREEYNLCNSAVVK